MFFLLEMRNLHKGLPDSDFSGWLLLLCVTQVTANLLLMQSTSSVQYNFRHTLLGGQKFRVLEQDVKIAFFPLYEYGMIPSQQHQQSGRKNRSTNRNTILNFLSHSLYFLNSTIKIEGSVFLASLYSFLKFLLFMLSILL